MKHFFILFLICYSFILNAQNSECDNVKIYDSAFDNYLQNEYDKIKKDTVLVFHQCGSSNGCYSRNAIIAWFENGHLFVKEYKKNSTNTKAKKSIYRHIEVFFDDKIYASPKTDSVKKNYVIIVDDGPIEFYVLAINDDCWYYSNSINNENQTILKWIKELSAKLMHRESRIKRLRKTKK